VMVNKGKTDPVIESTMGLIAKIFVPLKKVSHYFVGVLKIVSWNRIRCYYSITADFWFILYH